MTGDAEPRPGRPRSEKARTAVLEAVDDLLVEVGYSAMSMKGIAERAGVGRQTVYRWWSTKAEILVEACVADARDELDTPPVPDPAGDLTRYLEAVARFLAVSPAGLAYRALLGEAQHDAAVRDLVRDADVLTGSARPVLARVREAVESMPEEELAAAQLHGPVVVPLLAGAPLPASCLRTHAESLLRAWRA